MRAQEALRSEHSLAARALVAVEDAVSRFLPEFSNLRVSDGGKNLLIDHGSSTVAVRQMSDGERGILALVLDLTRRLFQANPEMDDPVAEAEVVVLIDEIDLHLHPVWQRQIVQKLTCNISKLPIHRHDALSAGHRRGRARPNPYYVQAAKSTRPPIRSAWTRVRVLEEIMDADPRTKEIQRRALGLCPEKFPNNSMMMPEAGWRSLWTGLGENDPEIIRIATLLDFLEGKE